MLAFLPIVAMQAQTTSYQLWICGRQVTSKNADNILDDNTKSFVYDASTKTLTVKGDKDITSGNLIENNIDGLTLNIARDVTFTSTGSNMMIYNYSDCSMTVKGDGKLTMSNPNGTGGCFYVHGNATLTIDNMDIDGEGQNVFWGDKSTEKLVLKNSTIHAKCTGSGFGAIFELGGGITFEGCHITQPVGGYVDMVTFMGIVQGNGSIAREVLIEPGDPIEAYQLMICGTYVNADNAEDVLGDGVFSYDALEKTLTIQGDCTYSATNLIQNLGVEGLIINTTADSKLSGPSTIVAVSASTTFTGAGTLTLQSDDGTGIVVNKANCSVTFDEANVDISGFKAFLNTNSTGQLTFKNSYVHAKTTNTAFMCYGGITIENCDITLPEGGKVDDFWIVDSEGDAATEVLIEPTGEKFPLIICGKEVTENNYTDVLGDGKFGYNPETQTLTVSGDCTFNEQNEYHTNYYLIHNKGIDGLIINVATNSELNTAGSNKDILCLEKNTTLTGNGKLTLKGGSGIFSFYENLTIENMDVDMSEEGSGGVYGSGTLIIRNSTVHATSDAYSVIRSAKGIVLEDCHITVPEGGFVKKTMIVDIDENPAKEVKIEPGEDVNPTLPYDLTICGKQVTNKNADDVLGNGAFSYDAETNILTVSGDASSRCVIANSIDGLTVNVVNDVKFEGYCDFYANTTLTGTGKLSLETETDCTLFVGQDATLTIDEMYIESSGRQGLRGSSNSSLIVRNSTIHATSTDTEGAFRYFTNITLEGCEITLPKYGKVDGGKIVDAEGNAATEVWIKPFLVEYGLTICGTTVTNENAADVLGDGAFRYDNKTKTLYVKGDASATGYNNVISNRNGLNGLTIYVANDVTLSAAINVIEAAYGNSATITGPGKLTLKSEDGGGIYCSTSDVTIDDMDIDITGCNGFRGNGAATRGNNFVVRNSRVYIDSSESATTDIDLTLEGCAISTPEGGRVENGHIVDSQGNVALEALIEPVVEKYDLWICGVDVTSRNADDVLGDGAFSYDAENKVLTVSGDIPYYSDSGIISNIKDLTVNVTQNVKMSTGNATIIFYDNATLTGTDSLTLHSDTDCGIYIYKATLTIENLNIEADGKWGLAGYPYNEYLIVRKSNIHAKGTEAAFCDFSSITLEGCGVTLPEGGYVDGGNIVDSEGNVAKEATISTEAVAIEGLAADRNKNTARYNLAGQRVGRDYKGIVIEGGKKILVK